MLGSPDINTTPRGLLVGSLIAVAIAAAPASADSVSVATFERGLPAGWTATANGWTVGGTTGTQPNITPVEGAAFARCGAPNVTAGPLAENRTGILTSPSLVVTRPTLSWVACGWSGQGGNGINRFEILNDQQQVVATVAAPLSDLWTPQSVNLLGAGLSYGDTFTFRAIDGLSVNTYAWLAIDAITISGDCIEADLNCDGSVDALDLAILLGAWGPAASADPADLDDDGSVGAPDLAILLGAWSA